MDPLDSARACAIVRAFLAIPLTAAVINEIQKVQHALQRGLPADYVRWTRLDQLHLTLRFFGNLATEDLANAEAATQEACAGFAEFQLKAEGVGLFPNPRAPRIVWVAITGAVASLKTLHGAIQERTRHWGEPPEAREFQPHLTIGRIKRPNLRDAETLSQRGREWCGQRLGEWRVDRVELMRSVLLPQGSTHSVLATARLDAQRT